MEAPTLGGVAVAFALLFVAFRLLELRLPREERAPLWRDDLWTDIAYWAVTPFTAHYVVGTLVFGAVALLAVVVHGRFDAAQLMAGFGPLSRWPFWLQSLLMLVIADFVGYWTHRAFHGRRLWRFHAVHHSSRTLDWVSSLRAHPVNDLLSRLATTLPLLALGFAPAAAAWVAPAMALFAIVLHARLDWDWGPLRTVIASPRFHRWHHATQAQTQTRDCNFAGVFPVWDILFGTYHLPAHRVPTEFGTATPVPEGLLAQWWFPFRRNADDPPGSVTPERRRA